MANADHLDANSFTGYALADAVSQKIFTAQQIGAPGYGAQSNAQTLGPYGRSGRPGLRIHLSAVTNSISYYNTLSKTMLGVDTTCIFSFGFRYSAAQTNMDLPFFSILDNATAQVSLVLNRDGTIAVYSGNSFYVTPGVQNATLLGTSDQAVSAGEFVVIGGRVVIHNSAGTVDLWFNGSGTPTLSLTGQDTRASANTQWTGFVWGPRWTSNIISALLTDADWDFSDGVVKDGSLALGGGVGATDPLGDVQVDWQISVPGNGDETGFSCFTGSDHGAMVDDLTPDGDSSFNAAIGSGTKDSYYQAPLSPPGGTVLAVITEDTMRKDGAGLAEITQFVISEADEIAGDATHTLTPDYVRYRTAFVDFDGDPITPELVDAMQAGPEVA